jgi:hypothetical protein
MVHSSKQLPENFSGKDCGKGRYPGYCCWSQENEVSGISYRIG